jgi:restriction system protein
MSKSPSEKTVKKKKAEFTKWFGPLLDAIRDLGDSGKPREASNRIAKNLKLPDSILDATLKSGESKFHNQVAWARQYLVWEGLLDSSKHGTWRLTDKGKITHLDEKKSHQLFLKWVAIHRKNRALTNESTAGSSLPDEQDEVPPNESDQRFSLKLIDVLRQLSPTGFEKVCRELLRESGFENVEITASGADDGIDGYGNWELNPFMSFKVMFQCKRYKEDRSVSRAQVGDFRNAMMGRAEKGIFMTTSTFSNAATQEAKREGVPQIELVDGERLVKMFEKVQLGLVKKEIFAVDHAYFEKFKV